ncbi:LL-diaminopimelate aminotransferase [bacterium BMS3Abin07]|nr:LL-diaminopimelate aminotransferase [bacterium BMS3Abin07]GBE33209.1 LL-diaminopimelate aminotransferase [bacterium BMS3Bbin05]
MSKGIKVELSEKLNKLPPYLFARIDDMKVEALRKGVDLIDLSIGDPDIPTPEHIVEAMKVAVEKPEHHRYPSYAGMLSYRQAVSSWYNRRFGVKLDPSKEVLSLIGSKEGIGHLPIAFINSGDIVLYTSPGYPVYPVGALLAGGVGYELPLYKQNAFYPDLDNVPSDVLDKAKLLFINYPNNPTSATADESFFEAVIEFALKHNIIVCHDAAYTELYYDGERPLSFMQIDGAKEVAIEMHSLSKTYNMTGWRIGYAVGNSEVISALGKVKSNLDSGVFQAIQEASIVALGTDESVLDQIRQTYQQRRDVLYDGLSSLGIRSARPKATFYLWAKVPDGFDSMSFTAHLLDKAAILTTPGNGFGNPGEGYVRFALTVPVERIKEAVERIKNIL